MVGGRRIDARVEDERQRSARRIASLAPKGPVTIESAMPGILREVRVEVGQEKTFQGQKVSRPMFKEMHPSMPRSKWWTELRMSGPRAGESQECSTVQCVERSVDLCRI